MNGFFLLVGSVELDGVCRPKIIRANRKASKRSSSSVDDGTAAGVFPRGRLVLGFLILAVVLFLPVLRRTLVVHGLLLPC